MAGRGEREGDGGRAAEEEKSGVKPKNRRGEGPI